MKAMKIEIKQNIQRTNSEGKETGIQINDLEHMEEINSKPEENEETRIKKKRADNKKTLGHLQKGQYPNQRDDRRRRGRVRN